MNNWLLFSAMVEVFLCRAGADWDPTPLEFALKHHAEWYMGDGAYGDGPHWRWDYYNSYVIQPMLYDTVNAHCAAASHGAAMRADVTARLRRYATVQERLISPEGTFPPLGRSSTYRMGAFQALALAALMGQLPPETPAAAVRCALTAVIHRMMETPGTFDENGWLRIGFCGHQPSLGEKYISTGSLYLCLCGLLPLGLPPSDPFWADSDRDWTAKRIWQGEDLPADHGMH